LKILRGHKRLNKKKHIKIDIDKDNFYFFILQEYISLGIFPTYSKEIIKVRLKRSKLSEVRGYENLEFTLDKKDINEEWKFIYFDGVEWIQLN